MAVFVTVRQQQPEPLRRTHTSAAPSAAVQVVVKTSLERLLLNILPSFASRFCTFFPIMHLGCERNTSFILCKWILRLFDKCVCDANFLAGYPLLYFLRQYPVISSHSWRSGRFSPTFELCSYGKISRSPSMLLLVKKKQNPVTLYIIILNRTSQPGTFREPGRVRARDRFKLVSLFPPRSILSYLLSLHTRGNDQRR